MLDRMSPEEFDERYAAWLVEWEDRWEQTGTIAAAMWNAVFMSHGINSDFKADYFMPKAFARPEVKQEQTAEDLKRTLQSLPRR